MIYANYMTDKQEITYVFSVVVKFNHIPLSVRRVVNYHKQAETFPAQIDSSIIVLFLQACEWLFRGD